MTETPSPPPPDNVSDTDAARIVTRGAWATTLGFTLRLGARLGLLLVAGRLYGAELFGAFGIAVSVVEALVAIAGLSSKKTLFLFLDRTRESGRAPMHVVLDTLMLVTGVGLALAAMVFAAAQVLDRGDSDTLAALAVLAPMIAGQALLDVIFAATRWTQIVRHEVVGRSLVEPYAALAAAAAAWLVGWREIGLALAYGAGTLAALAYGLFALRSRLGPWRLTAWRPDRATLGETLRLARANSLVDLFNGVYVRADIYLVGLFLGEAGAGVYNIARQLRTPIRQLRQSFDPMLTPVVATTLRLRGDAAAGSALASASRLVLAMQLPMVIGAAAVGAPVLVMFGDPVAAGYWALVILALAESVNGGLGVGDMLFVYRRPRLGFLVAAAGMTVGLALGLWLIPAFGVTGAALAILAGYAVNGLLRAAALERSLGARPTDASVLAVLAAGLAGLGVVVALRMLVENTTLVWDVAFWAAGLAVYGALLAASLAIFRVPLRLVGFVAKD